MSSDTDDTDDLLLIPPDFFLVQSEPEPPYYNIVDNLIRQVSNLQNRIESIEYTSDVSVVGSYLDNAMDIKENLAVFKSRTNIPRRFLSHDNLNNPTSTQSTPQKLREKIKLNSLPNSPNVNTHVNRIVQFKSPISKTSLENNKEQESDILNEIDTFISNVKTIQRNHTVRNLENEFRAVKLNPSSDNSHMETNNSNLKSELEESVVLIDKPDIQHLPSGLPENVSNEKTWQFGDGTQNVPDFGVKDNVYQKNNRQERVNTNFQPVSSGTEFTSYSTLDKSSDDSSSDSTQLTAYNKYKKQELFNRKSHLKDQQKILVDPLVMDEVRNGMQSPLHSNALHVLNMHKKLLSNAEVNNRGQIQKKRSVNTLSNTMGLLSLADIWGSKNPTQSPSKLTQKLHEEKLRRQHCEQLISDLQNKNLELQQKLAVAIQVDEAKNNTIQQFQEALEKVSFRMEKLNEEKGIWDKELTQLKNKHSIEIESANQKIVYYEKEASKALNLAHSNQDKILSLEHKCSDLQKELDSIERKFAEVEQNYNSEYEKNKSLSDILSRKEIEINENRNVLNNAREEVAQSRKAVETCQAEFSSLKNKCSQLESELKDNKNLILNLSDQKRKLLADLQDCKTNEKSLRETVEQSKVKLENTKLELRNFYQGQLELIVESKRKEMQGQLDQERQRNIDELKRKELSMAKTAASHIKEISEKCALETKLLEQKHQEEIRLFEIQVSQYKKEMNNLQTKLANLPEKRAQIAKQLQKVMENQWNEALKMISGSPSFSGQQSLTELPPKSVESYNNLRDLQQQPTQHHGRQEQFESGSDYDETPVSSRGIKGSESEIQKYINMLLNRPPGQPTEPPDQRATWYSGEQENVNKYDFASRTTSKEKRCGKPPWK
ncbi:uncharacterized protein LOC143195172 isoform X1 [Rhynchophorus ferrugineus]|uniref:uncharacterized protein LOC143195172 isoform X1 n=1 Tax=Rhynchophorus ferrugineus TaxID=354439 RepID=UPI003FCC5465